jgi:tRNA (guanine-N7-)-methyltransferase
MNRRPGQFTPALLERRGASRDEVNPYRLGHLQFGDELIPAESLLGWKDRWVELFGRQAPLHVELGTGNGAWIAHMAKTHPEWSWLGVEVRYKRCVQGAQKLRAAGATNGRMARYSWFGLDEVFSEGCLAGVHLNHPDPWPAHQQKKHRVIEPGFAAQVARWLAVGGEWRLKTDFQPHAEAMLEAIRGLPFTLIGVTHDLAKDGAPWPDDVPTPYQARFHAAGVPVHAIRVRRSAAAAGDGAADQQ